MRVLIQRVKAASVTVEGKEISRINNGLLLLVGFGKDDNERDIEYMAKKVMNLRIFSDKDGKMNLNIKNIGGQILSVSQFTLYANTRKGNRPGFDLSAGPEKAKQYWQRFNDLLRGGGIDVREGIFGAHMGVELINDGPVTIWLDSRQ
jgi:D-tyrosyl-tRNA(Tyr) deacylase